jgi:diguanylate cyclase (GGDEF)-like protein/PAS domain S-box-containing protein
MSTELTATEGAIPPERVEDLSRQTAQRYAIAAQAATDGLWDWNLQANEIYFSPRWKSMLGLAEDIVGNHPDEWLDRVHGKDLGRLLGRLSDHLHRGAAQFESEHRVLHGDGSYRWMRSRGIAVRGPEGEPVRMVGWQTDITDRKAAEDRLKHEAWHDPLTDLPNRAYFQGQLQRAAAQLSTQPGRLFALLFLDLDHFKEINDTLGHTLGDQVLIALSDRLRHSVRPGDTVSRIGGDEFAILLKNLKDPAEASHIAERIQRDLAHPFKVGEHQVMMQLSIGISLSSDSPDKPADLLRNADAAMYRAKSLGRARFELFNPQQDTPASGHYLEAALSRALENGEFRVHYQPIATLPEGRVRCCEALLRWQDPQKGLMLPNEFLPVAEETGMILQIGDWMLRKACADAKAWRDAGTPVRVSVNISGRQFTGQNLYDAVSRALMEAGLDPHLLQLELSESVMMEATSASIEPLLALSGIGVRICLDDFGMGYSSLIYLRRFPISRLKIDSFYIRELGADSSDATMAAGLIALAHSLGLKIVAERVETPEQLEFLRSEDCDEVQGDVICQPLSSEDCLEFLQKRVEVLSAAKAAGAAAR